MRQIENLVNHYTQGITSLGLLDGRMGQCVCAFVAGRMTHNASMAKKAEGLLEEVLCNLGRVKANSISSGIMGIALGMTFLVRQGYIESDVDEMLEDIDRFMYKITAKFLEKEMPIEEDTPILDVLLYMLVRYHTSNKKLQKRLYQKIIIQLFNYVYIHQPVGFWEEPMPFNVKNETCVYLLELMAIYQLGIEQERILHILEELKAVVLTRIPLLQPNRLFLMVTATYVGKITGDDGWYSFAARLQRHIDWERILVQDIPDKNLFPMTGVIGA